MSAAEQQSGLTLTREQIVAALHALSAELGKQSITGEICLFGGTVMVLAFTARLTTKDVDAIFQPAQVIRELSSRIPVKTQYLVEGLFDEGKI
jgi:hypothetical protein